MGCTNCRPSPNPENEVLCRIKDYIKQDNPSSLDYLFKLLSFQMKIEADQVVDKPLIMMEKFYGNFLCYALWLGKGQVFNYLMSTLKCSVKVMEEIFLKEKVDPMMVICEKGYIDVLKLYLPHYLKGLENRKVLKDQSVTISFSNNPVVHDSQTTYTPVQVACIQGHLNIIHYLNDFFSKIMPPAGLDLHHKDELTGENCALLSVRTGNFVMMKHLYETAKADFHIKNNYKEGVLQILAASTKLVYSLQYVECVMYLVEVIRVDISYMHEETLLLLESNIIIKYLEEKLKGIGILVTKSELENMYRIRSYKRLDESRERTQIVGDTQEISAIIPGSTTSNFVASHLSSSLDF